jgi:ATP-dependent Clp protease ATP-binding subunit ClpA
MFEHFDEHARRRVISLAGEEAGRRGDGRIGTEHLLLALLHDPGSVAAGAVGLDLEQARTALDNLDREALAAIGIDVADGRSPVPVLTRRRPPFTSGARAVLHRAVLEARAAKVRRVQASHLLLGVLGCQRPDPAAELLATAGVDPAEVRKRLTSRED